MMRVAVVCVVALACASVATAGFFTPKHEDVTVDKEGVVIGIQKDTDGKTKVSVSPQDADHSANQQHEEGVLHKLRPGEVICDAYGKCKEKIESFVGKTKEAAEEKVSGAGQAAKEEATGKAKIASEKAQKMKESVKDAASEASSKVKDKITKKATEAKEAAKQQAKEAEKMAKNTGKRGLKRILGVLLAPAPGVLHMLGFATAYGTCVWVTFASNYVLARALPRQQFAMVQSRMYPLYFRAMAFSVGTALLGYLAGHRGRFSPFGLGIFRGLDLMVPLVMVLVNLLYLEPRAAKVMFERMKKEKEEGSGQEGGDAAGGGTAADTTAEQEEAAAGKVESSATRLRSLNSHSSWLNIATLVSLTWHLVHLGHNLNAVC